MATLATLKPLHRSPGGSPPIRVAVLGARGKVGSKICRAVALLPTWSPEASPLDLTGSAIFAYCDSVMSLAVAKLNVRPISRLFKALGDETRLRIVALLTHGELCVCHVESALDLTQSNASRHLGLLRNAGIVEARRELSWVYYRLAEQEDPDCSRQLRALIASFSKHTVLQADVAKLLKVKGPGSCGA